MKLGLAIACLCLAAAFLRWYPQPAFAKPSERFVLRWCHGLTWLALFAAVIFKESLFAFLALGFYMVFLTALFRTRAR